VNCFVVYPEVKDKAPAVIVIHEIFGLTDWVEDLTDQLAEAGTLRLRPITVGKDRTAKGPRRFRKAAGTLGRRFNRCRRIRLRRPERGGRLCQEVAVVQRQAGGVRILLGWRANVSLCDEQSGFESGVFVLWPAADQGGRRGADQCPVYGFYGGSDNRIDSMIPASRS